MDLTVDQLPLSESMRTMLIRRHRAVFLKQEPLVARGQDMGPRYGAIADVHFSLIPREDGTRDVLIMFEPHPVQGSSAIPKVVKRKKH